MTGPEHYREAERLIKQANGIMDGFPGDTYAQTVAEAQVHATLALAAATALVDYHDNGMTEGDQLAWYKAASEQPAHYARRREAEQAEAAEFAGDPDFGPEAYRNHQPGCECWDCKAAREEATA